LTATEKRHFRQTRHYNQIIM